MKKIIAVAMFASPMFAFAALSGFTSVIGSIAGIVDSLVPILMTLAVVVFFWGLVKYISSASDEAAKEGGKTLMIWGLIALFIMVSLWSLLGFFQENLGLTGQLTGGTAPTFDLPGSGT